MLLLLLLLLLVHVHKMLVRGTERDRAREVEGRVYQHAIVV
jgi:hypothetical protein